MAGGTGEPRPGDESDPLGVELFVGSDRPCRAEAQLVSVAGWQVIGKRLPGPASM